MSDTIVAIATGPAEGGVGILRFSGARACALGRRLAPELPEEIEPRRAYFTAFRDPSGALLDRGLFLYFRAPHSFTGEEVVELHAHGGPRLLRLLLELALASGEARSAGPGEFTERAFLNGRIELSEAEAVADLISARSEAAVRAAASGLSGALGKRVGEVRTSLVELLADLSAAVDFPEETEGVALEISARLHDAAGALASLEAGARSGRLLRRGAKVVLFGAVNAGKSSLFNRLLEEERALVDGTPGTTRDFLEARWELGGCEVVLVDTAGVREGAEGLEAAGIARTRAAVASADAVIWVTAEDAGEDGGDASGDSLPEVPTLRVRSKVDLGPVEGPGLAVSARTGEGLEAVRDWIRRLFGEGALAERWAASERQAEAIRRAARAVERALEAEAAELVEGVSAEVGLAVGALGEITGESARGEVVEKIFQRFCIGK